MSLACLGGRALHQAGSLPAAVVLNGVATVAIYLIWHWPFDVRFGLPLLPTLIACVAAGMNGLLASVRNGPVWFPGISLSGSLVVMLSTMIQAARHDGVPGNGTDLDVRDVFAAIRRLTPQEAIVICRLPELIYFNADRQGAALLSDVESLSGRPPDWTKIVARLNGQTSRPLYLYLGDDPDVSMRPDTVAKLLSPGSATLIYTTASGRHKLWRVVPPVSAG